MLAHTLLALSFLGGDAEPTPAVGSFAVSTMSSDLNYVGGVPVDLLQGGVTWSKISNHEGDAVFPSVQYGARLEFRFGESATFTDDGRLSTTVGQQLMYVPRLPGSGPISRLAYHQVLATPFTTDDQYGFANDPLAGWSMAQDLSQEIAALKGSAAELVTTDVISSYYAYHMGYYTNEWQQGLLLRSETVQKLSEGGLYLHFDRAGYDFDPAPMVATDYVGQDANGSGLTATVYDSTPETLIVHLEGNIEQGDNLILIRNLGEATAFPAGPMGPSVGALESTSGDCTLPDVSCTAQGSCDPVVWQVLPNGGTYCVVNSSNYSAVTCEAKSWKIGQEVKSECGTEISSEECTEVKGGITVRAKALFGPVELEVKANGEITGKVCSKVTAKEGHKAQGYKCYTRCEQSADYQFECIYGGGPSGSVTAYCLAHEYVTATSCKFSDCKD